MMPITNYDLWSVFVKDATVAEAMDEGTPVYLTNTGTIAKARANAAGTIAHGILSRTVSSADYTAGGDRAKASIIRRCRIDGVSGFTIGGAVYLSAATSGAVTQTVPGTGNYDQILGYADSATSWVADVNVARVLQIQVAGNSTRTV